MRLSAVLFVVFASCSDELAPSVHTGSYQPAPGPTGTCTMPGPGCPCVATTEPRDCFLPPVVTADGLECNHGTMYCVDGRYSACNSLRTYTIPVANAILGDPVTCNPCDPLCAVVTDYPNDADLTGENSEDIEYDGAESGLTLTTVASGSSWRGDRDRDGVPDVADECDGEGYRSPCDGESEDDGFFHVLPFGGPTELDPLDLSARITRADVYLLMDTTASMDGELANLQADLTNGTFTHGCPGGVVAAVHCAIPDVRFGLGAFDDYPVSPYGAAGDVVYQHLVDVQTDSDPAQAAVNALTIHSGGDGPDGESQALYSIITGNGLGPYLPARTDCPAGTFGYPCFREGALPLIFMITDSPFHNGPSPEYDYSLAAPRVLPDSTTGVARNEAEASAYALGDVGGRWLSLTGDLCSYSNEYKGCERWATGGDAVFSFTLSSRRTITITLDGTAATTPTLTLLDSRFRTVLCDSRSGVVQELITTLDAGTYYVMVDNYTTGCGAFRLNIGEPPAAPPASYPVTWTQSLNGLIERRAHVVTIQSCDGGADCRDGLPGANALANNTASVADTGAPLVFPIPGSGMGIGRVLVHAVDDLVNHLRMDVDAVAVDNPATPEDETDLVSAITAVSYERGRCRGITGGTVFNQCVPGAEVNFSVAFRNTTFEPGPAPKVFDFWIAVRANRAFEITRIPVRIVIPAREVEYAETGTFVRDYDTTARCDADHVPQFNSFEYDVSTPSDTGIDFFFQTATRIRDLDGARRSVARAPGDPSPIDLERLLEVVEWTADSDRYMRVTVTLHASSDRTEAPVLRMMRLNYHCVQPE